jgi:uncharacterized repeat protein (TIGR03803 family)
MTRPSRILPSILCSVRHTAFTLSLLFAGSTLGVQLAQAQTLQVLHRFTGVDGEYPDAGLSIDAQGRLYGTTSRGGTNGYGTVFRLTHMGTGWVQDVLSDFSYTDGAYPVSRVILGPDGTLYGTTSGGGENGYGTVFNLQPPATACKTPLCPWRETVIHNFEGFSNDGADPQGDLVFDQAGNLYGTTTQGGQYGDGTAYELTKVNGVWSESKLYSFTLLAASPYAGVAIDGVGNLYGTIPYAYGCEGYFGAVYELSPSGSGWTMQIIYCLQQGEGAYPFAGLIFDSAGNLYGATSDGGEENGGTAFELSPINGGWSFSVLYSFAGNNLFGNGPRANLAFNESGQLYGTTFEGGANQLGSVFKLTPGAGGWTYTSLYDFNDPYAAAYPISNVVFDSSGNLYGTTTVGGPPALCDCGTVWQVTP